MLTKHESPDRQWFALSFDGALISLGDCGDYQVADELAQALEIDAMWLIDPEMAKQWADIFKTRGIV